MAESPQPVGVPSSPDHQHISTISTRTALFIIAVIFLFLYATRAILMPFVLPAILAYICTPLIDLLAARLRGPRSAYAIAVFFVILLVASGIGLLGIPALVREVKHVVTDLQGTVDALVRGVVGSGQVNLLGRGTNADEISHQAVDAIRNGLLQGGRLAELAAFGFAGMFGGILALVLLFYMLVSGPQIARGLRWLVPPGHRRLIEHIWSQLDPVLKRYFIGVVVVVAYAAAAAYVGLGLVLGIRHAVFLALMTGILEMIPVIGPGAAAVIAGLVAVQHAQGIGPIVAYAAYATCLRLSIDQLLGPVVLGSAARVHPALIIFCFLTGGLLFGIVGVILAVPVVLTLRTTLGILYDDPERPGAATVR